MRRNKVTDHVLNATGTIFYATSDFLIGILGIMAFAMVGARGMSGSGPAY